MPVQQTAILLAILAVLASALGAFVAYHLVGWLGVAILGLLIALIAIQVDMDGAAPIGSQQTTSLYADTLAAQGSESRAERASRHAEASDRRRTLRVAKLIGLALIVGGGLGFFLVQLPG